MKDPKAAKKKLPPLIRWILWALLAQFVLINISAALYAYRFTRFYDRASVKNTTRNSNILGKTWILFTAPKQARSILNGKPGFPVEILTLGTKSGLKIESWYCQSDSIARGTVILFHGMNLSKEILIDGAQEFRNEGYNVMMVDFRAHGNSDGNVSTIGVRESEEVKLAYDFVRRKGEKRIFLFGMSLGAVVVAKAVSDYSLTPAGLILEMPFLSLQSYMRAKARSLGFPEQPFALLTTFWAGVERGFNGYAHQTTAYLKNIRCPVLLQCGARDAFVPKNDSEKLFDAIGSAKKKMVMYERAQHEPFLQHDPLQWQIEVGRFLKEN